MPAQSGTSSQMVFWGTLLLALAIGIAFGVSGDYYYHERYKTSSPTDQRGAGAASDKVVARGRIKPRDGILSLGVPTPDRIRKIKVHEGDLVEKNAPLVVLDSEVLHQLEVTASTIQMQQAENRLQAITENGKAQIRVAKIRLDQIKPLETIEIKALKSKIDFLKAQEENARENLRRLREVGDTIAYQEREKQELAIDQIKTEQIATKSQVEKLTTSTALNRKLSEAQLVAAQAELRQSESAISLPLLNTQFEQAKEHLKESQILAPSKGKILRILLHEGELVRGEPIVQMANVERMIVLAEVYETDIERVRVGQTATIKSRIFDGQNELTGKVIWIASSVGKPQTVPLDPRAAVDNRVVDVKIELDQPCCAADFIDHQVDVEIVTKEQADKTEPRP